MHPGSLRALEFDRIVGGVCRFALTPWGLARLVELRPEVEVESVRRVLSATSETVRFLGDAHIGLQAPADLESIFESLGVEGRAL